MASKEVQVEILRQQSRINLLATELKRKQAQAERISNVEKKKVGSALKGEIRNRGAELDTLKRRIGLLRRSQTLREGEQRAQAAEAGIISRRSRQEIISRTRRRGGFISSGVLFDKKGIPVAILNRQGTQTLRRLRLREAAKKRVQTISTKAPKKITRQIRKSVKKVTQKKTFKEKIFKGIDVLAGGRLTQRNIDKSQDKINKQIETFNNRFENKTLTEGEFKQANIISFSIGEKQNRLEKEQKNLDSSKRVKFSKAFNLKRREERLSEGEIKERVKIQEGELSNLKSQIKKAESGSRKFKKVNLKRLRSLEGSKINQIQRTKSGTGTPVIAGDFPIIPVARIPSGVLNVVFAGKQKVVRGKIITDVVFKTNKGQVGMARGVTVTKDKVGFSVVAGRSGKVKVSLRKKLGLKSKQKVKGLRSFVGVEKVETGFSPFKIKETVALMKKKKELGTITIIKENLKGLQQRGIGKIATVKGKKFFKTKRRFRIGKKFQKKEKKISMDDFASISAVFTENELSLILGKSITRSKDKSNFVGLIKGSKDIKNIQFTPGGKQQLEAALTKVLSASAVAVKRADKISDVGKAAKLATAANIAKASATTLPTTTIKTSIVSKQITKAPTTSQKNIALNKSVQKGDSKIRQTSTLLTKARTKRNVLTRQLSQTKTKSTQKQVTKQLDKQGSRVRQISRQLTRQKSAQRLRLTQVQKQIQTGKPRAPSIRVPRAARRFIKPIPIVIKRKKVKTIKKKTKKKRAYNVFARPIKKTKKQKRPKLVKVNKVPLSKSVAKDVRNNIIDTSLARTGRIKKAKGKPQKKRLNVPSGYAKRTSKKFRRHRIVKGKRKPLPKGKVIEKRKHLLDTKQEKRKISLRRRIKQLSKKPKKRKGGKKKR